MEVGKRSFSVVKVTGWLKVKTADRAWKRADV